MKQLIFLFTILQCGCVLYAQEYTPTKTVADICQIAFQRQFTENDYAIVLDLSDNSTHICTDTVKVLERLSKSYKIGVIANQSLGTAGRLEEKGILQYIDLVIASAEEGVSKPDKKIFDIALSRANCEAGNAKECAD